MKWFITANQSSLQDPKFFELVKLALASARSNTSLEPYLGYDGQECDQLELIASMGVTVIPIQSRLEKHLRSFAEGNMTDLQLRTRLGAFLRLEIPDAILRSGITAETYLYTDCDVLFLGDFNIDLTPRYFGAVSRPHALYRWLPIYYRHFNSGVLLVNTKAMAAESNALADFIVSNGAGKRRPPGRYMNKNLFWSDQVAMNLFFMGKSSRIDHRFNWNPTDGICPDARIVHFNGMKWNQWRQFQEGSLSPRHMSKYSRLQQHSEAYNHYVRICESLINDTI